MLIKERFDNYLTKLKIKLPGSSTEMWNNFSSLDNVCLCKKTNELFLILSVKHPQQPKYL